MIILMIALVIIAAIVLCANFLYNLGLNPHFDKSRIFKAKNIDVQEEVFQDIFNETGFEDVWLESDDGLKLHGLRAMQQEPSEKWMIGIHGYTADAGGMRPYAQMFYEKGYHVLLPDNRGHGRSEGSYVAMGWHDRLDILKWIDFVTAASPGCSIVLYGVSMGGAAVMMTAGETLPDNVSVIIEDCGYTSVKEEMRHEAKYLFHLPYFPLLNVASLICKIRAGYTFAEASSIKQLTKAEKPMLFIHGSKDNFVPAYMLDQVFAAAKCPKEKLLIDGAGHGGSYAADPAKYRHTVFCFIERYAKRE